MRSLLGRNMASAVSVSPPPPAHKSDRDVIYSIDNNNGNPIYTAASYNQSPYMSLPQETTYHVWERNLKQFNFLLRSLSPQLKNEYLIYNLQNKAPLTQLILNILYTIYR